MCDEPPLARVGGKRKERLFLEDFTRNCVMLLSSCGGTVGKLSTRRQVPSNDCWESDLVRLFFFGSF